MPRVDFECSVSENKAVLRLPRSLFDKAKFAVFSQMAEHPAECMHVNVAARKFLTIRYHFLLSTLPVLIALLKGRKISTPTISMALGMVVVDCLCFTHLRLMITENKCLGSLFEASLNL